MTGTAVAALAMAALTASQAPGFVQAAPAAPPTAADHTERPESPPPADGNSPYHTELPPLDSPDLPKERETARKRPGGSEAGIPATVLAAYRQAEATLRTEQPSCGLPWELLAAIGKVESGHARGGAVDADGTTLQPILGPVLNGDGFAHITDTDGGAYDGDATYDRAVGPMQFIPSTWARWGADANGDGKRDPNNIFDATLAAGRYLCADGRDLSVQAGLERAILSYNHSREYLRTVLAWMEFYRKGAHGVPDGDGPLPDSPGAGNPERPAQPAGERRPGGGSDEDRPARPRPTATHDGTVGPPEDSASPTSTPTSSPTSDPTTSPTSTPTSSPTSDPTTSPTTSPTISPTASPTETGCPTDLPTESPTSSPTESPTSSPTESPSESPSESATATPTESDSASPTEDPEETEDPCGGSGEDPDGEEPDEGPTPSPSPSASRSVSGRVG